MAFIKKYSQAFPIFGWAVALLLTVVYGSRVLPGNLEVAVIAGLITIFGVSANHFFQVLSHREQEKAKREFEVRRDIYLEFAESIAKNWDRLSKLLRFDLPESEVQGGSHWFAAAGNKIRLVGFPRTVEAYEKMFVATAKFELSIRQDRAAINARITEIKQIDEQFSKNQETMTQINTYLQNMKPSGVFGTLGGWTDQDNTQIQNMRQQFGNLNNHNIALTAKRQQKSQELTETDKAYRIKFIQGITDIRPLITEVMISIRTELDVSVDEEWYRAVSMATDAELSGEFRNLLEKTYKAHAGTVAKAAPMPALPHG